MSNLVGNPENKFSLDNAGICLCLDEEIGVRLLLPHITDILTYIKGTVDNLKTQLNKRQDSCKELNILSRYFTSLI